MKLLWVLLIVCVVGVGVQASGQHHRRSRLPPNDQRMFVFGDSYADTGNIPKSLANSWKYPYGLSFPGKPTGRFSNGRVLTDFIARLVNIHSPIPYRWRNLNPEISRKGVNFAYGGTGVFNTFAPFPNLTIQVQDMMGDFFKEVKYNGWDIEKSMGLISIAGNDYITWFQQHVGNFSGIEKFIEEVITQYKFDVEALSNYGVRKIALVNLPPLGCVPYITFNNSYKECNDLVNTLASYHNTYLQQYVDEKNRNLTGKVVVLDLFSAFSTIIQGKGSPEFKFGSDILKPCCAPVSIEYGCGDVDKEGNKLYTVCEDPDSAFFWDLVHPTQKGWAAVTEIVKSAIYSLNT